MLWGKFETLTPSRIRSNPFSFPLSAQNPFLQFAQTKSYAAGLVRGIRLHGYAQSPPAPISQPSGSAAQLSASPAPHFQAHAVSGSALSGPAPTAATPALSASPSAPRRVKTEHTHYQGFGRGGALDVPTTNTPSLASPSAPRTDRRSQYAGYQDSERGSASYGSHPFAPSLVSPSGGGDTQSVHTLPGLEEGQRSQ